ncbi:hypothetical protein SAMN02745857_03071 [Andreprevotia lacus DSM 23236]|jgi:uncharacterized membrane protein|uniref:Transmembrane protein n=1 Tax=Andreprevotia lacus DSM 23236 TaxID=1121001 RepID=A0A1W1XVT5_9NEIS|nr:BPSS1780 family membrane protein [Andreprevotia lacus]SMC28036.1 hypothetical protein SAMN02745857_03071 [Andreprevotia lacus DSM 23236]
MSSPDLHSNPYAATQVSLQQPMYDQDSDYVEGGQGVALGEVFGWFGEGFNYFKAAPGKWMLVVIIWGILSVMLGIVPFLGALAGELARPVFLGGLVIGCMAIDHGDSFEVDHLFEGFKRNFGSLVLVGLLLLAGLIAVFMVIGVGTAIVGVSIFSAKSSLALHPALWLLPFAALLLFIPLGMAYYFAPVLVVTQGLQPFEAMKESFRGCAKNILPFLLFGVVAVVLMVLATLPLFLGWLVFFPLIIGAQYAAYKSIYLRQD